MPAGTAVPELSAREEDLRRAARLVKLAGLAALMTGAALRRGDTVSAHQFSHQGAAQAQEALGWLLDVVGSLGDRPAPSAPALAHLDTANSRRLLEILGHATELAELVDGERGNVVPEDVTLSPGETRGTDWAETLANVAARLRQEVEGPRGAGEGPRDRQQAQPP